MSDDLQYRESEWLERVRSACAAAESIADPKERARLIVGITRAIARGYFPSPARMPDILASLDE